MEKDDWNGGLMNKIYCPKCGKEAKRTQTKYGIRNYCPEHNLWSWGNAPMVDRKTHKARTEAHNHFDFLWKSKTLTRTQAYAWLAKSLCISKEECHMKKMDYERAKQVSRLCRNFAKSMNF